jgi:hypothetical protein
MRWTKLIAIPLISLSGHAVAQSVDQSIGGLETCSQTARLADSICEKQTDPKQRLNCVERTSAALLECLQHVLPDKSPPSATLPQAPASPPSASSEVPEEVTPKDAHPTGSLKTSTETDSKDDSPNANVTTSAPEIPATPEEPTGSIQSDTKTIARPVSPRLAKEDWIISETTSPLDYSDLVSAALHPVQKVNNGPISVKIRCRAKSTELSLQFPVDFNGPKTGELQLDYQIDDQPSVKQRWVWSAARKAAVYKGDPVSFLQSIPEGASLKIRALDADQAATFLLIGLDFVRKKVGSACKWALLEAGTSSPKR